MAFNRTYNQDNVEERAFELIPVGEYTVKISAATEKISKSSGKDMIELECEIINNPVKGKLWVYIVDDQYADQKIYDIFASVGKPIPKQINAKIFAGLIGTVKVKHKTENGETKAQINYWIKNKSGETPAAAPAVNPNDIPF